MEKKNGKAPKKNKVGRPPIWKDPIELKQLVFDYFNEEKKPTLAGLACFLGISRSTLYNYENKDKFLDIIKKARQKVESIYEERLIYSSSPTGVIFALKNMGWTDKWEGDITTKGKPLPTPILDGLHNNNRNSENRRSDKKD